MAHVKFFKHDVFVRIDTYVREINRAAYCPEYSFYCNGDWMTVDGNYHEWSEEKQVATLREAMGFFRDLREGVDYEIIESAVTA